jgi:hypothetical protein
MTKIRAQFSNGADYLNTRAYSDGNEHNIQVNSLNVNPNTKTVASAATPGTAITAAMVVDNDIFFITGTDIVNLADDLPVGTFIHLFATGAFELATATATDVMNNIASKNWTVPAADDILHCLKTHSANWQITEETKAGLDVQVIPNT